ncbi:hypothetical protein [uncultured Endozoicomonas sp.]|uniref:hypothetical protein n=1 Tax=uncultured Endozoicomonas sp. TaxID=432652 RepID=UPI0026364596|nr:hypothetical protein [uncultured Endozoicomonas sp.]
MAALLQEKPLETPEIDRERIFNQLNLQGKKQQDILDAEKPLLDEMTALVAENKSTSNDVSVEAINQRVKNTNRVLEINRVLLKHCDDFLSSVAICNELHELLNQNLKF